MSEILPYLYLGDLKDAQNEEVLTGLNIRAVVTCLSYAEFPLTPEETTSFQSSNLPTFLDDTNQVKHSIRSSTSDLPDESASDFGPDDVSDSSIKRLDHEDCNVLSPEKKTGKLTGSKSAATFRDLKGAGLSKSEASSEIPEQKPTRVQTIQRYRVCVEDIPSEPIETYFREVGDFIDAFVVRKQAVLVHCKAGVSRSATIVLSYLLAKTGFSLSRAFYHVLSRRKKICPNMNFMDQLCDFEVELSLGSMKRGHPAQEFQI